MEKQLEQYKKSLKLQNGLYIAAAAAVAALMSLSFFQVITPAVPSERWASAWNGFLGGLSLAAFGIMAYGLILNLRALRDEKRLRKLYPGEVEYDAEAGEFRLPLTQEETFALPPGAALPLDVRVKFAGGEVLGSARMGAVAVCDAISGEVL